MTRRLHIAPAGRHPNGSVPVPARLRELDRNSSEMVNGDEGGTFSLETPLVLGCAGASPTLALTTAASEFTGDVETLPGNSRAAELEEPGLVLPANANPPFETARGRTILVAFSSWAEQEPSAGIGTKPGYELDTTLFGARGIGNNELTGTVPFPPRASHNGATIANVVFKFVVTNRRKTLPNKQPRFRVLRISTTHPGGGVALLSAGGGADADGWKLVAAADVATYWNSGKPQTLSYTPNQNNVVDTSLYHYILQFLDEVETGGPGVHGNIYLNAVVTLSNLTLYRPE